MIRRLVLGVAMLLSSTAASAKWHEASSAHFVVYADQDPEKLRAFATKLERFDKAMRVMRGVPDLPVGSANRLTVYVVNNVDAVQRLAGRGSNNVAGFYVGRASGSIAVVPRRAGSGSEGDLNVDTIFFHEYAHHFMLGTFPGAFPAWLTEGFAEFHSTARFEADGGVGIGLPANHRAYGALNAQSLPLAKMLTGDYKSLTPEQIETLYGRGWLLTHYLTFEPSRKGQLAAHINALNSGRSPMDAATSTFGDVKQLERELSAYVKRRRLSFLPLPASQIIIAPISIRPLSAGEAAFLPVRMRSTRGVDAKTAAALVTAGRRAAAPFVADPVVQAWLAEVEHDADNLAEADAAADRALAADPKNGDAMIYKGRIAMKRAVAAKATDKATWAATRKWFVRASQADPEDAEPKMLFHSSFAAADAPPTRNAVAALLYAQQLVPQDQGLRMQVVRQHLIDGNAAQARLLFGPIAYDPHGGAFREWASGVMTKLAANDAKGALAIWDERASVDAAKAN